ncbi:MAG: galactose ABC transporter substrate-binding protein [Bacillota bacterium]
MRKIMILTLAFLLVGVLTACGDNQKATVPLVVYDMNDDYMQDFTDKILDEAERETDIELHDSKNSQIIQNEIIEKLIEEDPPLIIVNPVDRLGARMIIQKAKQAEIPLIFINREPLKEDLDLYEHAYYIGADPVESARLQAETIIDLFGEDPGDLTRYDTNDDNVIQTAILMGQQGHQDAELRTKHVIRALEDFGYEIDILDIKVANFNRLESEEATTELIETFGDELELIISNNDAMAVGAISALVEEGVIEDSDDDGVIDHSEEPWLPVVGIDGLDIATELIESGHLYATVLNDSAEMAEALVELVKIIEDEDPYGKYSFTIENDTYVWIDYKTFVLEIEEEESDETDEQDDSTDEHSDGSDDDSEE